MNSEREKNNKHHIICWAQCVCTVPYRSAIFYEWRELTPPPTTTTTTKQPIHNSDCVLCQGIRLKLNGTHKKEYYLVFCYNFFSGSFDLFCCDGFLTALWHIPHTYKTHTHKTHENFGYFRCHYGFEFIASNWR